MENFVANLKSGAIVTGAAGVTMETTPSELFKNFLADKRTILAYLRTGIAILTLPLSMITILIATSSHYNIPDVILLFSTMVTVSVVLLAVGIHMVVQSFRQLGAVNRRLGDLEERFTYLSRWENTGTPSTTA